MSSYRNKDYLHKSHGNARNNNEQQARYILPILFCATVAYNNFALFRAIIYQASFSFKNFPPCSEFPYAPLIFSMHKQFPRVFPDFLEFTDLEDTLL